MRMRVMTVCLVLLLYFFFTQCDARKSTSLSRGLSVSQHIVGSSSSNSIIKKVKIVNTILSISTPCVSVTSLPPEAASLDEVPPSFCVLPLSPPSSPIVTIPGPTQYPPNPPPTFPSPAQNTPITFPTPTGYIPIPPPSNIYPGPPDSGPTPITPGPILGPPVFEPPVVFPAPTVPPPANGGPGMALWCVAKPSVPDPIIQEAMDYACGSGADCGSIQPSGSCFQPDTLYAHASYAFNSFWQTTKVAGGTCEFGGTAMLVTIDPSYGGCSFLYY